MSRADTDLVLRPALAADLAAVAEVMLVSRAAAYPAMPDGIHEDDEVRAFVAGWDLDLREVWVAEADGPEGTVVAFAALAQDWLDFLFVLPGHARAGVGSALLDVVKSRRPRGFGLWVFTSNRPARDFYARHGMREVEHTDGSGNEERQPDVRMTWQP